MSQNSQTSLKHFNQSISYVFCKSCHSELESKCLCAHRHLSQLWCQHLSSSMWQNKRTKLWGQTTFSFFLRNHFNSLLLPPLLTDFFPAHSLQCAVRQCKQNCCWLCLCDPCWNFLNSSDYVNQPMARFGRHASDFCCSESRKGNRKTRTRPLSSPGRVTWQATR